MAKKQVQKHDSGQVDLSITKIELEEINYDLDSDTELENNTDLIKYEFNMIELPFFTKDKKVDEGRARKYIFSEKNQSYMMVSPSGKPGLISHKIPQEFDEKIFYGILKLSREQGGPEVITDYFTLAKVSGVHYNDLTRIKDSLERLSNCNVELQNLVYSAEHKMKMRGKEPFPILQHALTYTFEKVLKIPEDKREKYQKCFRNSKINEILVIEFGSFMYRNLEKKGFLYFDQKKLLEIKNATARKIYLMITKWKGWENKNYIRRSCRFLASRIPLSWESRNIANTLKSINKSCEILKEKELIGDYDFVKTKPVGNSYVTFIFNSDNNMVNSYNKKASRTTTGQEKISIHEVQDEFLEETQDNRQMTFFNDKDKGELLERENKLAEIAELAINEMSAENRDLLRKRALKHHQYEFDEDKVEKGIMTREQLTKSVMISIMKGELEHGKG